MNTAFKEFFMSGEMERFCRVSISQGRSEYAHEMSTLWFRSGFKISIENDLNIKQSEINELSLYILSNAAFVRQLMALGFDTLVIKGKTTGTVEYYALKKFANLNQYYIQ